jgi:hypothetical protein
MAEEAPADIAKEVRDLLRRPANRISQAEL